MKFNNYILVVALVLLTNIMNAQNKNENDKFSFKWSNGFKLENESKTFSLKFGGRIMYDMGFYSVNDEAKTNGYTLESENGDEFRRARFFISGVLYNNVDFKFDLDFTAGKVTFKDMFITLKKIPGIGNLRIGHFKEPYRLEYMTSSKYITFIERSTSFSMMRERNTGIMLFDEIANKRASFQLALLRSADVGTSDNPSANGDYAITSRVAVAAIKNEKSILHLGGSYRFGKPQESKSFGYSLRPEAHMADKYIKVSLNDVKHVNSLNFEAAWVYKAFSLQGEFQHQSVNTIINKSYNGYYVQGSYFLTGESRNYKGPLKTFGRVSPKKNFGVNSGAGAFEMALRYSYAEGMNNDDMSNITVGLNWHLNPATRIMANYIVSNIENNTDFTGSGQFNAILMRFQIDF